MRHRINCVHFVGIGGAGMSGIAEVLHNLGYAVQGSDIVDGQTQRFLRDLGIKVTIGHAQDNIKGANVIVVSSAVPSSNPEVRAAIRDGIPVVPRVKMLNELLRLRQGIAVAGSHGKTTITSMTANVLHEGGLDPTYVVGGLVRRFGSSAGLGNGDFIVVETDESDGSFLHLSPVIAVASNIDADHLQQYGQDLRELKRAFIDFFENLPFYGVCVLCADDPQLNDVKKLISKRVISYGLKDPEADFHAHNIRIATSSTSFILEAPYGTHELKLNTIGEHNVANALAALAVAHEVNVAPEPSFAALENFAGVGRRLESHGKITLGKSEVLLVDDYAHHPTEISASLAALRAAYPDRRLVLVFQPHRYSRTHDLLDALADCIASADIALLTEVYAAGELPIANSDGTALANAVRLRSKTDVVFVKEFEEIYERIGWLVKTDDLVVTMGAGTIGQVAKQLADKVR